MIGFTPFQPSPYEAALLLLKLHKGRETETDAGVSRFRISELTLRRLCCRPRLSDAFVEELRDWLLQLGWALFWIGQGYALVKADTAEGWVRLGSKRIAEDLEKVAEGKFNFGDLAKQFPVKRRSAED